MVTGLLDFFFFLLCMGMTKSTKRGFELGMGYERSIGNGDGIGVTYLKPALFPSLELTHSDEAYVVWTRCRGYLDEED